MAQITTFYPCDQTANDFCLTCNSVQNPGDGCESDTSRNTVGNASLCSAYCNTGCNSSCNQAQTICATGSQFIKDHADVGGYPGDEIQKDDIIKDKWTPAFWNSLIDKLNTAENVGKSSMQGSALSMVDVAAPQPITAKLYNDLNTKLCNFNVSYDTVDQNDLITAAIANAIKIAYEHATFDDSVCDVCNSDQTMRGGCGCNCNCSCDCNCGCGCNCDCNCGCNCSCDCDCDCGPSCATNTVCAANK